MDNEFESVRIGENCLLGSGKVLRINLDLFLVGYPAHWFKANLQPGFSACMTL